MVRLLIIGLETDPGPITRTKCDRHTVIGRGAE